ncbi:cytidine deaminase [Bifidobacterium callitrichos]|uniref:Cytidine deaminase n=1 Tax=Bifidobacterium callitrichos TaxID=762209 RepID=A0A5M9ZDW1_9BIFI|nr:cytidine deaminase [Bifidobacterium callitrichos]KAA8817218.1 cytidine deaminase [Bifidobacterium callitrichos]
MQVNTWDDMHRAAMRVLSPRAVSNMVEAGGVAAAVESLSGRIYVGVCVDTACALGVCAERNALFNMITNGEDAFRRVIAVDRDGKAVAPCGACRELMAQLMPESYGQVEIMMDYERARIVTLGDLTPQWWI